MTLGFLLQRHIRMHSVSHRAGIQCTWYGRITVTGVTMKYITNDQQTEEQSGALIQGFRMTIIFQQILQYQHPVQMFLLYGTMTMKYTTTIQQMVVQVGELIPGLQMTLLFQDMLLFQYP